MKILFYIMLIAGLIFSSASHTALKAAVSNIAVVENVVPAKPSAKTLRLMKKVYKKETKGMTKAAKKAFYEEKAAQNNAKLTRVPLFISALALVLIGCLIVFLAWTSIGYLGSIIAIIGLIMLVVWLIFRESEAAKS